MPRPGYLSTFQVQLWTRLEKTFYFDVVGALLHALESAAGCQELPCRQSFAFFVWHCCLLWRMQHGAKSCFAGTGLLIFLGFAACPGECTRVPSIAMHSQQNKSRSNVHRGFVSSLITKTYPARHQGSWLSVVCSWMKSMQQIEV